MNIGSCSASADGDNELCKPFDGKKDECENTYDGSADMFGIFNVYGIQKLYPRSVQRHKFKKKH